MLFLMTLFARHHHKLSPSFSLSTNKKKSESVFNIRERNEPHTNSIPLTNPKQLD